MKQLDFRLTGWLLGASAAFGIACGCSVDGGTVLKPGDDEKEAGAPSSGGARNAGGAASQTGGRTSSSDGGPSSPVGAGGTVGALDGSAPTTLPELPPLKNVTAREREDSVGIDFDPVDHAVDYRVYELPADGDVTANADGSIAVHNALYRCAGLRQTFHVPTNQNSNNTGNGVLPTKPGVVFASIYPYITATVPAQPVLGHVYTSPGAGRVPVYAVGTFPSSGEGGWRESRNKIYTTDSAERATLLSQGGRDDGIVFYVPSAPSADTVTLYRSATVQGTDQHSQYYYLDADRATHDEDDTPPSAAFPILRETAADAEPLYAVFYQPGHPHTELAAGKARFERAASQGPGPLWHLEWSGITKPTTLVIEALAGGCPYQGFLSPQHLDAPPHQTFYTLDELRAASPTGEVYVNGQYDVATGAADAGASSFETTTASPVPIARAFLKVSPHPHDPNEWDWYEGFSKGKPLPAGSRSPDPKFDNDAASAHYTSSLFDFGAYSVDNPNDVFVFTHGELLGQFWSAFDDWRQDVTGRLRWTAQQSATIDADPARYLHVTWSVTTVSTARRYPQLIVTDQPAPVEDGLQNPDGNFLIVQTINGPSMRLDVEAFHGLVNGNPWAVNNQADAHALIDYEDENSGLSSGGALSPADPPLEHAGMDRMTRYDAFVSSGRLYVFMDGSPAACTQLPGGAFSLKGSVTVTFGDVLYHEGAETEVGSCTEGALTALPFLNRHQCTETARHWDDLGFKSGVAAPDWDEKRFPCKAY